MIDERLPNLHEIDRAIDVLMRVRSAIVGDAVTYEAWTADPVEKLRAACADLGIGIAFDDRISERDAARLLGLAPQTLRNRRYADQPIPHSRVGRRVMYRLGDLADYLEKNGA